MAETLTYENTTETTSIDNLNADEQDSLKVGEAIQEEQESLLAGKYKNAEDLEKAYVELEKKLGGDKPEQTTEDSSEPEVKDEKEDKPDQTNILDELWDQSKNEKFDDRTLETLNKMKPSELANMHLQFRASQGPKPLTQQDVTSLKNVVGGDENYTSMMQWANTNLQKQEVDMFDAVMEQGNPLAAFFAVQSLAYRYNDATGVDGKMTAGTAPKASGDVFRSQQEVVAAMSDKRYDNDPAYRQDLIAKLERSDVKF